MSFGNFAFLSDFTFLSDFLTGENRFEVVRCRDNDGSTSLSDIAVRQFVERRLEPDLGKVVFTSTWGSSGTDLFKVFSDVTLLGERRRTISSLRTISQIFFGEQFLFVVGEDPNLFLGLETLPPSRKFFEILVQGMTGKI